MASLAASLNPRIGGQATVQGPTAAELPPHITMTHNAAGVRPIFFYNDTTRPGQQAGLNFFEPRYKIMSQRCSQTHMEFLWVPSFRAYCPSLGDIAVLAKIDRINFAPDGRASVSLSMQRYVMLLAHWVEGGTYGLAYATFCELPPASLAPLYSPIYGTADRLFAKLCESVAVPQDAAVPPDFADWSAAMMATWQGSRPLPCMSMTQRYDSRLADQTSMGQKGCPVPPDSQYTHAKYVPLMPFLLYDSIPDNPRDRENIVGSVDTRHQDVMILTGLEPLQSREHRVNDDVEYCCWLRHTFGSQERPFWSVFSSNGHQMMIPAYGCETRMESVARSLNADIHHASVNGYNNREHGDGVRTHMLVHGTADQGAEVRRELDETVKGASRIVYPIILPAPVPELLQWSFEDVLVILASRIIRDDVMCVRMHGSFAWFKN